MEQSLDNKEYIFALLTALVKREGGELRITEEQVLDIFATDVVSLFWDEVTREVVLQIEYTDIDYTTVPDNNEN